MKTKIIETQIGYKRLAYGITYRLVRTFHKSVYIKNKCIEINIYKFKLKPFIAPITERCDINYFINKENNIKKDRYERLKCITNNKVIKLFNHFISIRFVNQVTLNENKVNKIINNVMLE